MSAPLRWAPHPFSLRQLQYVLAVAEHRNFRRAAEACAVAQPSLSSQIAQMEAALGAVLFERLPRGVLVTEVGAALVERARRVLLDADDLVAAAERARDPLAATLRIGVIPTVAPYLLPTAAAALRAELPRMQLVWIEEKTRPMLARLEAGEMDAGILATQSDLGDLEHVELGADPFVLAVPPTHRLARSHAPARISDLEGETVLLLDDGHCFRDQALAVCDRGAAAEASVRATSLTTLVQMVAGGTGITLLPRLAEDTENRAGSLVTRPFGARGPCRTLGLAWRKTSPAAPALRAVAAVLARVVSKKS